MRIIAKISGNLKIVLEKSGKSQGILQCQASRNPGTGDMDQNHSSEKSVKNRSQGHQKLKTGDVDQNHSSGKSVKNRCQGHLAHANVL